MDKKVSEVADVSQTVDAGAKKALENSMLILIEQKLPFMFFLKYK